MNEVLDFLYRYTFGQIGGLDPTWQPYLKGLLFILIALVIGLAIRQLILARLGAIADRTDNVYDDVFLLILKRKTILWVILVAALFTVETLPWDPTYRRLGRAILTAALVFSITLALVRGFADFLRLYGEKSGTGSAGTTLIRYVGSIVLWAVGLAVILSLFDVSLLPAITALGVGGLAVALAFQDTLANIFAGIYITLSGQIRVGDYVEIGGAEQGFVNDISWRTTTFRTLANNLIIVPNKKLAESTMINYHLPAQQLAVEITLNVAYDTDPDRIEEIIVDEILSAVGEIDGLVGERPAVRFNRFGDSALEIKTFPQVDKIENQFEARHRLMKRLYGRLRREGIEIPYPIRTLRFEENERKDLAEKLRPRTIDTQSRASEKGPES